MTDAHQSFLEEQEANASKVTQLQAEKLDLQAQNVHEKRTNLDQVQAYYDENE